METLKKIKTLGISAMLIGILFVGCKKETNPGENSTMNSATSQNEKINPTIGGSLTVKLVNTSPPSSYKQVNVEITRVDVEYSGASGWITLTERSTIYDLIQLNNTALVDNAHIPLGQIAKLRLFFGPTDNIILAGKIERSWFALEIPSIYNSGIEININSQIEIGKLQTVILDFESSNSVSSEGNNKFVLYPVIKVKSPITPGPTALING